MTLTGVSLETVLFFTISLRISCSSFLLFLGSLSRSADSISLVASLISWVVSYADTVFVSGRSRQSRPCLSRFRVCHDASWTFFLFFFLPDYVSRFLIYPDYDGYDHRSSCGSRAFASHGTARAPGRAASKRDKPPTSRGPRRSVVCSSRTRRRGTTPGVHTSARVHGASTCQRGISDSQRLCSHAAGTRCSGEPSGRAERGLESTTSGKKAGRATLAGCSFTRDIFCFSI